MNVEKELESLRISHEELKRKFDVLDRLYDALSNDYKQLVGRMLQRARERAGIGGERYRESSVSRWIRETGIQESGMSPQDPMLSQGLQGGLG